MPKPAQIHSNVSNEGMAFLWNMLASVDSVNPLSFESRYRVQPRALSSAFKRSRISTASLPFFDYFTVFLSRKIQYFRDLITVIVNCTKKGIRWWMHNAIRISNHEDFSTLKRWLNVFARQSTTLPERPLSVLPGENGFNRFTFENSIRSKWRMFQIIPYLTQRLYVLYKRLSIFWPFVISNAASDAKAFSILPAHSFRR